MIFYGVAEEARQDGFGVIDMDRLREYQDSLTTQPSTFTRTSRASRKQGPSR